MKASLVSLKNISITLVLLFSYPSNLNAAPNVISMQSSLIGKVFNDKDRNGYQDANEEGIAGVHLATLTGLIIVTDSYGRYNIPDDMGETQNWGSNLIIKLDHRSLPQGSTITTENPRIIRFSNSGLSKVNFGVQLP
jgi:hypothetical protein